MTTKLTIPGEHYGEAKVVLGIAFVDGVATVDTAPTGPTLEALGLMGIEVVNDSDAKGLDEYSVQELKDYATSHEFDIDLTQKKADLLAAVKKADTESVSQTNTRQIAEGNPDIQPLPKVDGGAPVPNNDGVTPPTA